MNWPASKTLIIAGILALAFSSTLAVQNHAPEAWVDGTWVVRGSYEVAGVTALGKDDVDALVGTRVRYGPHEMLFGLRRLNAAHYSVQVYSDRRFEDEFKLYCRDLGVCGAPIIVVECTSPSGAHSDFPASLVVVIDRNHLAAMDGGVFLKLERINGRPQH